jgi:hypothetical protein
MRTRAVLWCAIFLFSTSSILFATTTTFALQAQDKTDLQLPEDEAKAATAINAAPDAAAKLAKAAEFMKKYPKSTARPQIAQYVSAQIGQLKDPAQKLQLAADYQKIFTADPEIAGIRQIMLDAYLATDRVDDAFDLASTMLTKDPGDVYALAQLTFAGANAAKRQNKKYLPQAMQYGAKAIELIEADKKPAGMNDATWSNIKAVLPQLYQQLGILSLLAGSAAEGKSKVEKAIALNPGDPLNYLVMSSVIDDDYRKIAELYKSLPAGPQKDEALSKANAMLDQIIELYAHAVGLAAGQPQYQQLESQVMENLTSYYKYRHNQSLEGLQQLINKYKRPANP